MQSLEAAIDGLYKAFSAVPKPHHINGCPCCINRKEIGTLLGKRLRDLTASELTAYASSAFLTVGEVRDYLYFLPRILEVTATEPSWWPDPEVTGRAIRAARPEMWTAGQRAALHQFLRAVLGSAIQSGRYDVIDAWICGIGRMGFDVRPFLDQVAESPAAVLGFFEANAECLPRKKLCNAFWELPWPAHDAVVEWFYSDEIARIPLEAYGYILKLADGGRS